MLSSSGVVMGGGRLNRRSCPAPAPSADAAISQRPGGHGAPVEFQHHGTHLHIALPAAEYHIAKHYVSQCYRNTVAPEPAQVAFLRQADVKGDCGPVSEAASQISRAARASRGCS